MVNSDIVTALLDGKRLSSNVAHTPVLSTTATVQNFGAGGGDALTAILFKAPVSAIIQDFMFSSTAAFGSADGKAQLKIFPVNPDGSVGSGTGRLIADLAVANNLAKGTKTFVPARGSSTLYSLIQSASNTEYADIRKADPYTYVGLAFDQPFADNGTLHTWVRYTVPSVSATPLDAISY